MCSDKKRLLILLLLAGVLSCSPYRKMQKIRSGTVGMTLSVPEEPPIEEEEDNEEATD